MSITFASAVQTASLLAPVITGVGQVSPFDIVLFPEGSVTSDLAPTVMGTAVPGSRVQVFDNGILLGEATAGDDWQWQYTLPTQSPTGDHLFTATATSADGTTSADTPYGFSLRIAAPLDVSPPEVLPEPPSQPGLAVPVITGVIDHVNPDSGVVADGGFTLDRAPTLQGTSVPGTVVEIFDNGTAIGQVVTADDWTWSYTLSGDSALGEHVLSVVATTADGSATAAAPYTHTVHVALQIEPPVLPPPVITGVMDDVGTSTGPIDDGGTTDDRTPTLQGTSVPGTQVQIFDNGTPIGEVITADDWSWQFTLPRQSPSGEHVFSVVASTSDGFSSAAAPYSQTLYIAAPVDVDPALPVPVITGVIDNLEPVTGTVTDGGLVSDGTPTVTGTSYPGSVVTVFDNGVNVGQVVTGDDWTWRLDLPDIRLGADDLHTVTVSASTADGQGTTEGVYPFQFHYALILYADGGASMDQLLAAADLPATAPASAGSDAPAASVMAAALPADLGTGLHPELLH